MTTITNSSIEGILTGIRMKGCENVTVTNNAISSSQGSGIEMLNIEVSLICNNSIAYANLSTGIVVGAGSKRVALDGNTFPPGGLADIEINPAADNITVNAGCVVPADGGGGGGGALTVTKSELKGSELRIEGTGAAGPDIEVTAGGITIATGTADGEGRFKVEDRSMARAPPPWA